MSKHQIDDIQELKSIIEQQKNEIFNLQAAMNQLNVSVYWKDLNGVYLGCNNYVVKMAGAKNKEEVIGKTDFDLPWKKYAKDLRQIDSVVFVTGKTISIEETPTIFGSHQVVMLTHKSPLKDKDGIVIGLIGISIDITERKQMEIKLDQARQQAEVASEAKSEFIANMSHDLRTPLTGVVGMAQDMIITAQQANDKLNDQSETTLKASFQEVLDTVKQDGEMLAICADELVQLCNEILETVSLESGKSTEVSEAFNLHELVEANIALLLPAAKHKKLNLTYEIDGKVPTFLKGIRAYLDRSLLNLISNAIKFTQEGFVKVKVRLADDSKATHSFLLNDEVKIYIAIEDSGIGIPKDKFEKIFEHFSRLTSSYQGIYKGAGLGLYTVKQYVKAMNGTVEVDSELAKGSIFTLNLPFTVSDHADQIKKSVLSSKKKKISNNQANPV